MRACVFEKVGETIRNGFKLKKKSIYLRTVLNNPGGDVTCSGIR